MAAQILSSSGAESGVGHFKGTQLHAAMAWGTQCGQWMSCSWDTQPGPSDSSVAETPVATAGALFPVPGQRSLLEEFMSSPQEAQEQPMSPSVLPEHPQRATPVISPLLATARPTGDAPQQGWEG